MTFAAGQIVLAKTWDDKERPTLLVDRKGGDWMTVPFTTQPHTGAEFVWDWRENHLYHECWLFHFMQRVAPSGVTELPVGVVWCTRQLAESVVKTYGHQLSAASKRAVLDAHKNRRAAE